MDVLALRKSSGEIEGEVRLNGHLQEPLSFRRCMGYVEQFDVQSSQLTGKKFRTFLFVLLAVRKTKMKCAFSKRNLFVFGDFALGIIGWCRDSGKHSEIC